MKQHITEKQLREVDFKKIHKLVRGAIERHPFRPNEVTIGKMIEILSNIDCGHNLIVSGSEWNSYNVKLEALVNIPNNEEKLMMPEKTLSFEVDNDCLCDALWEAVKEIL